MPSKSRSASQAAKDKAALKRLAKSGTYGGKIDLRKAPTRYQQKKIAELKASRSRKSQPLPPKQKTPGATIKRSRMSEKQLRELKPKGKEYGLTTYALPFLRKGEIEPEWRRFTYRQLSKFLEEYKGDDPEGKAEWRSYAVKETWTFERPSDVTEMRRETNLFFSGVRIDEPHGQIKKKLSNKKGSNYRKRKPRKRRA